MVHFDDGIKADRGISRAVFSRYPLKRRHQRRCHRRKADATGEKVTESRPVCRVQGGTGMAGIVRSAGRSAAPISTCGPATTAPSDPARRDVRLAQHSAKEVTAGSALCARACRANRFVWHPPFSATPLKSPGRRAFISAVFPAIDPVAPGTVIRRISPPPAENPPSVPPPATAPPPPAYRQTGPADRHGRGSGLMHP